MPYARRAVNWFIIQDRNEHHSSVGQYQPKQRCWTEHNRRGVSHSCMDLHWTTSREECWDLARRAAEVQQTSTVAGHSYRNPAVEGSYRSLRNGYTYDHGPVRSYLQAHEPTHGQMERRSTNIPHGLGLHLQGNAKGDGQSNPQANTEHVPQPRYR